MKRTNMSGALYRLIYCSRNMTLPGTSNAVIDDVLPAILSTARTHNKVDNITGALLFTATGFAQVLEGAREMVERTFERISADPRHTDVTVLSFTPAERRSFPDWSMGFSAQVATEVDPLVLLLGETTAAGPRATTGSDVLRLLEKMVQREDEWAVA